MCSYGWILCTILSKKESEFPAISAYGSYGGGYLFLILKIIVFLLPSILGFSDYMVPNSATQDIRNYGTKWTDQKPVRTYLMSSDESNVFDPNKIDPSLEVHDIVTGGNGEILLMQLLLPITEKS